LNKFKTNGYSLLLTALLLLLSADHIYDTIKPAIRNNNPDFRVFYVAGKALSIGENIYQYGEKFGDFAYYKKRRSSKYLYTPLLAFFFTPISRFPYRQAQILWLIIEHISLLLILWLILKLIVTEEENRLWLLLAAVCVLFSFYPLKAHLIQGQVDLLILLLLIGGAYLNYQLQKPYLAGLLLGLASYLKLTPSIIVFLLFVKREYKLSITSIIFIGVLLILSWFAWPENMQTYVSVVFPRLAETGNYYGVFNQSPLAFIQWFAGKDPANKMFMGVIVLLLGWGSYIAFQYREEKTVQKNILCFALFVLISMLCSGVCSVMMLVWTIFPFSILFLRFNEESPKSKLIIVIAFLLIGIPHYIKIRFDWGLLTHLYHSHEFFGVFLLLLILSQKLKIKKIAS